MRVDYPRHDQEARAVDRFSAVAWESLTGITREVVCTLAPEAGFGVSETAVTLDDAAEADEAFTSSSIMELVPVTAIDGRAIPQGEAAEALMAALRKAALG